MQSSIRQGRRIILSLQYLRALAAVGVVLFHQFQNVSPIFILGKYGVGLFFIISGIIMVSLTEGRAIKPLNFFIDRLTRVAPMYWIATFITFILGCVGIYSPSIYSHGIGHFILSCLFIPSLNEHGNMMPTLFIGWTLNYEMFFYLVFGALLLIQGRYRLIVLAMIFLSLALCGVIFPQAPDLVHFYTSPYLLEFLAGCCLGAIFGLDLMKLRAWPTVALIAAVIIAMAGLGFVFPLLWTGAATVLLVATFMWAERRGYAPSFPLALMLGNASYSIYLFQQIAFDATQTALRLLHYRPGLHTIPTRCVAVLLAILTGIAVYRFIETPLTKTIRRALDVSRGASNSSSKTAATARI
ncbi:acyltransferase [Gluconacetobacter asukensis]|uniref:Acyltransferase n=1 Tax=Gluconacetobacter asukensis TaxID=1017181 RepID=A0A7W4IXF0_9PROT|nr:acyltransferase [Gluconacetobacter asukensis]